MIAPAGRHVGRFEIRHKLGRGGMADVYLATDTGSGQEVALKLIEHARDADTCDSIEAERRGAELQARLAAIDPRVVRVFDCGDVSGCFYVAMEYIDGQDLAELMRHGALMTGFATEVAVAVANTLENAHLLEASVGGKEVRGMVHGDIKPKNIRINAHGDVRVLDFGIAKALSMSRRLTRNEFGSVPYASPERLETGEVNFGSDLWSLGVMLYEMVTGMQPYHAESTERLERMIRSRIAPPPAPDPCPEPLRRILMKAMAPDPERRYASAAEFAADLEAFRAGLPVSAAEIEDPEIEDRDATRRTVPRQPEPPSEETRRTTRPASASSAPTKATFSKTAPAKSATGTLAEWKRVPIFHSALRVLSVMVAASVIYGSWLAASDYRTWQQGQDFARQLEAEQVTDLEQIWTKWTELSRANPSSLFLRGPRKVVKQRMLAAADHVIDIYRTSESQPVYEKDWERARLMASRALAVEPDESVRGKVRLAEGHIARINGTLKRSAPELNRAVERFTDAQRLLPHSPDPELGLARVYVYGLKDIDKAYAALEEARRLGYNLGNREKLQLADGYRDRADRLWTDSRNIKDLPPEKDQLQRAQEDYKRATEIYQSIAPYGGSNAALLKIRINQDLVTFRLMQIEGVPH